MSARNANLSVTTSVTRSAVHTSALTQGAMERFIRGKTGRGHQTRAIVSLGLPVELNPEEEEEEEERCSPGGYIIL